MSTSNAKSNYLEQKIIEAVLKNTSYTGGANTYIALMTAAATPESGTVTEVAGGSYARQAISATTGWSAGGQVGDAYEVSNAGSVTFSQATADWGLVTHFAVYDALASGNLLYYGALDTSKQVYNGDTPSFPAGTLKVNES